MSDYGSLYLIETSYNSGRDATEVIFGYMENIECKGNCKYSRMQGQ